MTTTVCTQEEKREKKEEGLFTGKDDKGLYTGKNKGLYTGKDNKGLCTEENNYRRLYIQKKKEGLYAGKKGHRLFTQEKTTQFCTDETRVTDWTQVALNQACMKM